MFLCCPVCALRSDVRRDRDIVCEHHLNSRVGHIRELDAQLFIPVLPAILLNQLHSSYWNCLPYNIAISVSHAFIVPCSARVFVLNPVRLLHRRWARRTRAARAAGTAATRSAFRCSASSPPRTPRDPTAARYQFHLCCLAAVSSPRVRSGLSATSYTVQ